MQNEIVAQVAATVAGGGVVGLVARVMIASWFKRHDEMMANVQATNVNVKGIEVELRGVQIAIENFRRADELIRSQDRSISVISSRLDRIEKDLHEIARNPSRSN